MTSLSPQVQSEDLWGKAFSQLSPTEQEAIASEVGDKRDEMQELQRLTEDALEKCRNRQWRLPRRREGAPSLILRDVIAKIAHWIDRFVAIGDVAVQYDPGHAALPWAGLRFLMKVAISDVQKLDFVVESIQEIARLIGIYAIYERIYLTQRHELVQELCKALVDVYSAVLGFLARMKKYLDKRTVSRILQSALADKTEFVKEKCPIMKAQDHVDRYVRLLELETQLKTARKLDYVLLQDEADHGKLEELKALLDELRAPIQRLDDYSKNTERTEVLDWLSRLPHPAYHYSNYREVLENTGTWLLEDGTFKEWRDSSASSLLWLHGSSGTGKSKLMSIVVDDFIKMAEETQGCLPSYFYCSRDPAEPERAASDAVLASIARQLSCRRIGDPVLVPALDLYKARKSEGLDTVPLSAYQSTQLVQELAEFRSVIVIAIDALDECEDNSRHELIQSLKTVLKDETGCPVKVIISSRPDGSINSMLDGCQRLSVSSDRTTPDIEAFAEKQTQKLIENKRLLRYSVDKDYMKERILETLKRDAHGMFWWVSMNLEALCTYVLDEDIIERLGRLPRQLRDIYHEMFQSSEERVAGKGNKVMAKLLKWLSCSEARIPVNDMLRLLSPNSILSIDSVLDISCNLVVYDDTVDPASFRFAHPSVLDFLRDPEFQDQHPEYAFEPVNAEVAMDCIATIKKFCNAYVHRPEFDRSSPIATSQISAGLVEYAFSKWLLHLHGGRTQKSDEKISKFVNDFILCRNGDITAFDVWCSWRWRKQGRDRGEATQTINPNLDWPQRAFYFACAQGFGHITKQLLAGRQLKPSTVAVGLGYAASNRKHENNEIVRTILQDEAKIDFETAGNCFSLILQMPNNEQLIKLALEKHSYGPVLPRHFGESLTSQDLGTVSLIISRINAPLSAKALLRETARRFPAALPLLLNHLPNDRTTNEIMGAVVMSSANGQISQDLCRQAKFGEITLRAVLTDSHGRTDMLRVLEHNGVKCTPCPLYLHMASSKASLPVFSELLRGKPLNEDLLESVLSNPGRDKLGCLTELENLFSKHPAPFNPTESIINTLVSSRWLQNPKIFHLFESKFAPNGLLITARTIKTALKNPVPWGSRTYEDMVVCLLDRGGPSVVTEEVLLATLASRTSFCDSFIELTNPLTRLFTCILTKQNHDAVTDRLLQAVLRHGPFDNFIEKFLHEHLHRITTETMLKAAVQNHWHSDDMTELILGKIETLFPVQDVQSIVKSTLANPGPGTWRTLCILSDRYNVKFALDESDLEIVIAKGSKTVLKNMLKKGGSSVPSQAMAAYALQNRWHAAEMLEILQEEVGLAHVIEELALQAIESDKTELILPLLEKNKELSTTKKVVLAVLKHDWTRSWWPKSGWDILACLLSLSRLTLSYEVLSAAAESTFPRKFTEILDHKCARDVYSPLEEDITSVYNANGGTDSDDCHSGMVFDILDECTLDWGRSTNIKKAVMCGDTFSVDRLARQGIPLEEANECLYHACMSHNIRRRFSNLKDQISAVRALTRAGAAPSWKNKSGLSPLSAAARQNNFEIVQVLLEDNDIDLETLEHAKQAAEADLVWNLDMAAMIADHIERKKNASTSPSATTSATQ